jgi:hypothetical protein
MGLHANAQSATTMSVSRSTACSGMLDLVGHPCRAVLHASDRGVGIVRVLPIVVRHSFSGACAVELPQLVVGRIVGEPRSKHRFKLADKPPRRIEMDFYSAKMPSNPFAEGFWGWLRS